LGVVLLVLSLPCIGAGAILMVWERTNQAGLALMGQGVIMLTTGVGFMLTRDNKASEEAHQESLQKIAAGSSAHAYNAERIDHLDAKVAQVPAVVAQVVEETVPPVIAQVKEEVREEARDVARVEAQQTVQELKH
jgi:hypothetical protein